MIVLPWPSSSLSGHAKGSWRDKAGITAKHRAWAKDATLAAMQHPRKYIPLLLETAGDIKVIVTFYPPDRRGDRTNYPNRLKPYFDGIADALKVNDRRFLPSYHFAEPVGKGAAKVVMVLA